MKYSFSFGGYSGIFALPAEAADKYINEASAEDFKVLLYVFRHSGETMDSPKVCGELSLSEEQLQKSLRFWGERKLFASREEKAAEEAARERIAAHRIIDVPEQYGQEDIAKKSQANPEIKFLLESVPDQLGRPISPSECSTLVYLYEGAGLPADVIVMLVGYCVSVGKSGMRFIEKAAVGWAEEGIDTYEKAESKIKALEERRSYEGLVRSVMGIKDRALSQKERQLIEKWSDWKLPQELVKLAYEKCVAQTGKSSVAYMNSILEAWHKKGFKTVEEARNENRPQKKSGGKNPSYDIDEYVRLSMNTLHNE